MAAEQVVAAMQRLLQAGGSEARSVIGAVAGRRFHHLEEGGGPPIVLLHGGSGGGANWFRLLPRLAADYRVLAPDLPGFGLSAPQPLQSLQPPLGAHAAALLDDWLGSLGVSRAVVVGTSFGGLAALRLAQRFPARVAGLMLLDSAGLGRGIHPLVRLAALPGLTRPGVKPTRRGTDLLLRTLLAADLSELSASQAAALSEYLYRSAAQAGTDYLARTLRLFLTPLGQREVATPAELHALPQPVAVVWGARDTFLPLDAARRAAAHLADGSFTVIEGAGHSPNWERADAVEAAIRALVRRVAPGTHCA